MSGQWVLLAYRVPRQPPGPRIAIWRGLERIGVARLGDGLVALPADARTREHLDWMAEEIIEAGGSSTVWLATPATEAQERQIAAEMRAARAAEYRSVIDEATAAAELDHAARVRTVRRLRAELRRIGQRDYFPPPDRATARDAVRALADAVDRETVR